MKFEIVYTVEADSYEQVDTHLEDYINGACYGQPEIREIKKKRKRK